MMGSKMLAPFAPGGTQGAARLASGPGRAAGVLVTAFASGASTSLVVGVQGVRLFPTVLAAPVLVRHRLNLTRSGVGT